MEQKGTLERPARISTLFITITRAEGPIDPTIEVPVNVPFTFRGVLAYEDARTHCEKIARCMREDVMRADGGYDKTDFEIHYTDGYVMGGRLDIRANGDDTDLRAHVSFLVEFHLGRAKPDHLTQTQYMEYLEARIATCEAYRHFAALYDTYQGEPVELLSLADLEVYRP